MPERRKAAARRNQGDRDAKQVRALEARARGLTWPQVAQEAGYASADTAMSAAYRAIERRARESLDYARHIDVARCEQVIDRYMPAALQGDYDAARVLLQLMGMKAKLLGLEQRPALAKSHDMDAEVAMFVESVRRIAGIKGQ